ncbi:MAG: bifunctional phosphopantothenoylcysteine decarboxylase/phosphopantothenate--cysteine ligase CoaBC [Solirubrobacteraceae bacterium]
MSRILLGVSGGIAAYKALEFVRLATAAGHSLRVIQTPAAQRFVGAASFAALTGAPTLSTEWERDPARGAFPDQTPPAHEPLSHLELVANADLLLVAPASANTIAKLAHGLADNLLSSAALAARCPLLIAPAMNDAMYEHPATQTNLALLRERGARVLEPGVGRLASKGEWGVGRLPEPAELLQACEATVGGGGSWAGLTVLVTAGGTREPIDSVRYVGNRSSGRMGFALASEAAARGADVVVVAANVALPREPGIRYLDVGCAAALQAACEAEFERADVLLMAAAVADFRPVDPSDAKISKSERTALLVELEATTDVLALLSGRRAARQTLVGFAAEHGDGALERARAKLARKRLDAIVVNDISAPGVGFDSTENEVVIVTPEGEQRVQRTGKRQVAVAVLDAVERVRLVLSST